ncbi:MAG: FtsX-like permease family protein [Promethearchaeota archaeon]
MKKSFWFMWKKGFKTIIKNKKKIFPILVLMCFTISIGSAMYHIEDSRSKIVEEIKEYSNIADGLVNFFPLKEHIVNDKIREIAFKNLDEYEKRLIIQIKYNYSGIEYDGFLVGIDTSLDSHINKLVDENKEELKKPFCLSWNFANDHDIEIGDEIALTLGSVRNTVVIKQIGFSSEFLYVILHEETLFPSLEPIPVMYVDINYMSTNFLNSSVPLFNQLLYKLRDKSDQEAIEVELKESFDTYLIDIVPQEEFSFIRYNREKEKAARPMVLFFITVFLIGAVITLIIVIHRLIEYDLKSVSVFQGLGATKSEIIGSYMIFNLILTLISLILGGVLAFLIDIPIGQGVASQLGVPIAPEIYFEYNNIIFIGSLLFFASILSTFVIAKRTFSMDVQESLKYETKFLEKPNLVERLVTKVKSNVHPFTSYNIRRIFGKKLFLSLVLVALTISSSFIMFSFGIADGYKYSTQYKLTEIEKWDGVATTWRYESENTLKSKFNSLSEIEYYEVGISDIILFSKNETGIFEDYLKILAFEEDSQLHVLEAEDNVEFEADNEALVSSNILDDYSVNIGEKIYIRNRFINTTHEIKIIGVVKDMMSDILYLNLKTAQKVIKAWSKVNTIYFTIDNKYNATVADRVQDLDQVRIVDMKEKLKETLEKSNELIDSYMLIFGGMFTLFGLLISAVIIKNIIEYRIEDYATMKALGLRDREVKKAIIQEILIYFVISIPIGILIGEFLIMGLMERFNFIKPGLLPYIHPISFFYFGISMIFMITVILLKQFKKLKKMNISELTKAKTFG